MARGEGWQVALLFQDGKSNKFWRARCSGKALEVNYGRIGSDGQRQVKRYDSAEDSAREMHKQAAAKRRKGYVDDPQAPAPPAGAAPETASETPPPRDRDDGPRSVDLVLELDGRRLELRLSLEGRTVRTAASERYASDAQAAEAFERLREALGEEGYRPLS